MARCKECEYFEDCKKRGEEHWEDRPYSDAINNVEECCSWFKIKTEREKDMVSCKDCANGNVCGDVMDKGAELCEAYTKRNTEICKEVPDEAWLKEKEAEETTLKIKAAGYDVIKGIVGESFENVWESEETVTMIDGVLRMEEAVIKTLI